MRRAALLWRAAVVVVAAAMIGRPPRIERICLEKT
jgi:hypothetical protein